MAAEPVAVLVHGAYAGPWVWASVVTDLEAKGLNVCTVTLPGHDRPGHTGANLSTVGDYVAHLAEVVGRQSGPVVLVGHSMGGYVIQRFLENQSVAEAVLIASVPPTGTAKSTWETTKRHPLAVLAGAGRVDTAHLFRDPVIARETFFTPDTSEDVVGDACASFCSESPLVLSAMAIRPIRTGRIRTGICVVAGERDRVFAVEDQQRMAHVYNADLHVIAESGHNPMLEGHHGRVADLIATALLRAEPTS